MDGALRGRRAVQREREAADIFQAANAAYHFLTTNNFDYKRWKESFTVPPMQSLDEVLMMALSGEDPYNVEILLKKRGEYRPHRDFGVNLSIPWNAGHADDPSYDVGAGSVYTTTKALEDGAGGADGSPKELGSTAGADDDAYAMALDELVARSVFVDNLPPDVGARELAEALERGGAHRARVAAAASAASGGADAFGALGDDGAERRLPRVVAVRIFNRPARGAAVG